MGPCLGTRWLVVLKTLVGVFNTGAVIAATAMSARATSVADLVKAPRLTGSGAYLCMVDITMAYKNFVSDPLNWPLLCVRWGDTTISIVVSMPF